MGALPTTILFFFEYRQSFVDVVSLRAYSVWFVIIRVISLYTTNWWPCRIGVFGSARNRPHLLAFSISPWIHPTWNERVASCFWKRGFDSFSRKSRLYIRLPQSVPNSWRGSLIWRSLRAGQGPSETPVFPTDSEMYFDKCPTSLDEDLAAQMEWVFLRKPVGRVSSRKWEWCLEKSST